MYTQNNTLRKSQENENSQDEKLIISNLSNYFTLISNRILTKIFF